MSRAILLWLAYGSRAVGEIVTRADRLNPGLITSVLCRALDISGTYVHSNNSSA